MLPVLVLSVLAAVAPLTPLHVVHPFQAVGRYAAGDRGVDLAGVPGQPVASATAGTVLFAGPVAGIGVVSVGLPDGQRLTYEPLAPSVHAGDRVAAGQQVGRLAAGRAGCPAPACLHWGLVTGRGPTRAYADPLALLGGSRVRLLPLAGSPAPGHRAGGRARPTAPSPPPTRSAGDTRHGPAATAASTPGGPTSALAATALAGTGTAAGAAGVAYARRRRRASRRPARS